MDIKFLLGVWLKKLRPYFNIKGDRKRHNYDFDISIYSKKMFVLGLNIVRKQVDLDRKLIRLCELKKLPITWPFIPNCYSILLCSELLPD